MMTESATKKILDSGLVALLKGLELSPWIKVPAVFVAEISKRFNSLPSDEKSELGRAGQEQIASSLRETVDAASLERPDEFAASIQWVTKRQRVLDHWNGLSQPAVDELVSRFPEARNNVSATAPPRSQVAQLVAWLESTEGPEYSKLIEITSDF